MCKKDNQSSSNNKETNKSKKFFYVFISILSTVLIAMSVVSFIFGNPQYIISKGVIYACSLVAILLVFDSIESLNVGNVLSLKTKVKEKEKEIDKLSEENTQLRNQFISVMTNTFNKQSVYVGYPKEYVVENADKNESEDDETIPEETKQSVVDDKEEKTWNYLMRKEFFNRLKIMLLVRFQETNGISGINLHKEVKITNIGVSSDPIIERDAIYDAYIRRPMDEIFINIYSNMPSHVLFDFRLYFMISRVYYYGQANQVKAKMILLVPKLSESYINAHTEIWRFTPDKFVQRLKDMYNPAIQNELLEIVEVEITDEEIKQIENEINNNA